MSILNRLSTITLSLFLFGSTFAAKNTGTISGKVTERSNGNPLPFATVSLQDESKKILGGATTSDDGNFQINNTISGKCNIKVSFIGFKDTTFIINIQENSDNVNLGEIKLASDAIALKSAVVIAKVPVIEQKLDKIVMNVSESVSVQGNNALELLKKAPGISMDSNGNLLLNGVSVNVWIDGRPSNMSGPELQALLTGTDGSTIDKIEIISHPSSKYDAAGKGGIVNIKTKRNFAKGLNGSVRAGYTAAPFEKYYQGANGTLNLNYRGEKSNTTITYSPEANSAFEHISSITNLENNIQLKSETRLETVTKTHSYRVANDFFISNKDIFGFIINGFNRGYNCNSNNSYTGSDLINNGVLTEKTKTALRGSDYSNIVSGNLNYTHIFSDNHEFTVNTDYGHFDFSNKSNQDNIFSNMRGEETRSPLIFNSDASRRINILSLKADYQKTFLKSITLEAGAKWAQSRTNNELIRNDQINDNWILNSQLSSKFNYTESISAAYISLAKQFGTVWSLKGGLRAEMTNATGDWISADTVSSRKYVDIFPTAFAGYIPNKNLRLGLSYTMRIDRPNFRQLNPFKIYLDANSCMYGSPNLNPEYNNQFNLSVGIKKYISINFSGEFVNDVIVQNPYFDNETGEKTVIWENFGKQTLIGGTLSISELPITKWLIFNASGYIGSYKTTKPGYEDKSIYSNLSVQTTLLLPKDFKVELSGYYRSKIPFGYFIVDPICLFSVGAKKLLLQNKATIALNINDIFDGMRNNSKVNTDQINNYSFYFRTRYRTVNLSFQCRFGQSKRTKYRQVGNFEESSRAGS